MKYNNFINIQKYYVSCLIFLIYLKIKWADRLKKLTFADECFVSIYGTDCMITERKPYSKRYFSYKFNGPGLKYEIGLSIKTGRIVWVNGGIPCGLANDLSLARSKFVKKLLPGEKAIADKGYKKGIF